VDGIETPYPIPDKSPTPATRPHNPNEQGRPKSPFKPDATVWEPESLKKARQIPGLTDEQARREQRRNKGSQVQ
jgi:hypothetical protein